MKNENAGLVILDVTNSVNPRVLSKLATRRTANGVFLRENRTYVAEWGRGLNIIDVGNPVSPAAVGGFLPGNAPYSENVFDVVANA
ncbi:MAG: hypothetical protein EXS36_01975 [Pedosphaera sp.]|nr:hypothetical protein [Pedosphaera sp.]